MKQQTQTRLWWVELFLDGKFRARVQVLATSKIDAYLCAARTETHRELMLTKLMVTWNAYVVDRLPK